MDENRDQKKKKEKEKVGGGYQKLEYQRIEHCECYCVIDGKEGGKG